jgi:phospholipid N-methyltransferase
MSFLKDCAEFLGEFRRNFHTTGAILPSSRFLARALVSEVALPRGPARILEVGPGTGPVTREIARVLQPDDRLVAVEINPKFVRHLRERIQIEPLFKEHAHKIELIEAPVESLPGEGVYDFIISGLPFNNFPPGQVRAIFRTFVRLLKPGGTMTYFEYLLVRQLKTPFVNHQERRRLRHVGRVIARYVREYQVRHKRVLVNVPPATVRHLRFKPAPVPTPPASTPIPELTS